MQYYLLVTKMWLRVIQVLFGFLILLTGITDGRLLKFTNVKCMDLPTNEGITKYEYCRLKVVKRNYVELSLKVSLLKLPIKNMTTRLQFFQRSDGYRPFMYNLYFDFCKLMGSKTYIDFTMARFVFNAISKHSNMNHSCPFTENHISVEKFALDSTKLNMPFPSGVYRLDLTFFSYGKPLTLTQVHFEKID